MERGDPLFAKNFKNDRSFEEHFFVLGLFPDASGPAMSALPQLSEALSGSNWLMPPALSRFKLRIMFQLTTKACAFCNLHKGFEFNSCQLEFYFRTLIKIINPQKHETHLLCSSGNSSF